MSLEKLTYMDLPDCIKLSNGTVDVIASTAIGPRLLFYMGQQAVAMFSHAFRRPPKRRRWVPGSLMAVTVCGSGPRSSQPPTHRIMIRSSTPWRATLASFCGSPGIEPACEKRFA